MISKPFSGGSGEKPGYFPIPSNAMASFPFLSNIEVKSYFSCINKIIYYLK
jgi:hypothetical protein